MASAAGRAAGVRPAPPRRPHRRRRPDRFRARESPAGRSLVGPPMVGVQGGRSGGHPDDPRLLARRHDPVVSQSGSFLEWGPVLDGLRGSRRHPSTPLRGGARRHVDTAAALATVDLVTATAALVRRNGELEHRPVVARRDLGRWLRGRDGAAAQQGGYAPPALSPLADPRRDSGAAAARAVRRARAWRSWRDPRVTVSWRPERYLPTFSGRMRVDSKRWLRIQRPIGVVLSPDS